MRPPVLSRSVETVEINPVFRKVIYIALREGVSENNPLSPLSPLP